MYMDNTDSIEYQENDVTERTYCVTCSEEYEESDLQEVWIGCDLCNQWYHLSGEGLRSVPEDEIYICVRCQN